MYTLDNGVELNREFPDSFFIPSEEEKQALNDGDFVKLIFREGTAVERMWVEITDVVKSDLGILHFVGVLDSEPFMLESLKCGDRVEFSAKHIIQTT